MKSIKYTLAALALIAIASFSTAKAQTSGDVFFGVFNSTDSLAFDLGAYSSLANGEQFNLGNVSSLVSGPAKFAVIATSAGDSTNAGGIPGGDLAVDGNQSTLANLAVNDPDFALQIQSVNTIVNGFNSNQISSQTAGTNVTKVSYQLDSDSSSFAAEDANNGFGLGGAAGVEKTYTGNDSAPFYFIDYNNSQLDTLLTFSTSTVNGDTILTYGTALTTPEPSAYALGLTALALFLVLKRRSSTVA
jgi:hypothetical protein